jgi:hypothetical protein
MGGMRTLAQAGYCGVAKPERKVIRTQAAWEKLWAIMALPRGGPNGPAKAPEVDWSKEMVLAAFMGTKSTGGYQVRIEGAAPGGGKLVVTVAEKQPPPDAITAQVITSPFHLVAVPKSTLPVVWKVGGQPGKISP